jgi:hypothetical protein
MRATIVVASILLFTAGLAWAGEPEPAADVADLAKVSEPALGTCTDTQPLPEDEAALAAWAEDHGFLGILTPEPETATVQCPQVISCNATHCIETTFCGTRDTGNISCCTTGGGCLFCPTGQTIQVKQCRCAGGGCMNPNSQTFFCA